MIPRLMVLTDRRALRRRRGLSEVVQECADAGLTHVDVREHDLPTAERSDLVAELAAHCGLTVLASRRPDPGAHGLHLAATQPLPPGRRPPVLGRSCHDVAELARAAAEGCDYATLSPYATSASKPGYGPPVPAELFASSPLPVLALSGVHRGNAAQARAAGAHGVAVMGAVMRAQDPAREVADLVAALR